MLPHKNVAYPGEFFLSMTPEPAEILYHCYRSSTYKVQHLKTNCSQQKFPPSAAQTNEFTKLCVPSSFRLFTYKAIALRQYVNEEVAKWISQFPGASRIFFSNLVSMYRVPGFGRFVFLQACFWWQVPWQLSCPVTDTVYFRRNTKNLLLYYVVLYCISNLIP